MTKDTPMRRIVASAVLAGFMTVSTACYGPFNLTRNVYHWNSGVKGSGEVSDKWMKELVFFGMIVVPVYMFSALLDAFIFNSIQFWSGQNPVKVTQDEEGRIREVQLGKITASVTWAEDRKSAHVTYVRQGRVVKQVTIEHDGDQLRLRELGGHVLVTAETPEDGSLRFIGRDGRVADVVGSEQARWAVEQLKGERS
ncbi:DUF3332 family protein [Nitrospira sp. NS4]|uniref:DUF3332 family protein n=1 Tax=Nitrospira sp. NS4 TaxID=3414498 RepID=UPI003C2CC785